MPGVSGRAKVTGLRPVTFARDEVAGQQAEHVAATRDAAASGATAAPNAPARNAPAPDAPARNVPAASALAPNAPARNAPAPNAPARNVPAASAPAQTPRPQQPRIMTLPFATPLPRTTATQPAVPTRLRRAPVRRNGPAPSGAPGWRPRRGGMPQRSGLRPKPSPARPPGWTRLGGPHVRRPRRQPPTRTRPRKRPGVGRPRGPRAANAHERAAREWRERALAEQRAREAAQAAVRAEELRAKAARRDAGTADRESTAPRRSASPDARAGETVRIAGTGPAAGAPYGNDESATAGTPLVDETTTTVASDRTVGDGAGSEPADGRTRGSQWDRRRRRRIATVTGAVVAVIVIAIVATVVIVKASSYSAAPPVAPAPKIEPPGPVLAGANTSAEVPTATGLTAALAGPLTDKRLGSHISVAVRDLATGRLLYGHGPSSPTTPASSMKLATATALLGLRGPNYPITTSVVARARPGEVVLVGAAIRRWPPVEVDLPRIRPSHVLADEVKRALGGVKPTRVIIDTTLFSGPATSTGWQDRDADSTYVHPIYALTTDGGRIDPTKREIRALPQQRLGGRTDLRQAARLAAHVGRQRPGAEGRDRVHGYDARCGVGVGAVGPTRTHPRHDADRQRQRPGRVHGAAGCDRRSPAGELRRCGRRGHRRTGQARPTDRGHAHRRRQRCLASEQADARAAHRDAQLRRPAQSHAVHPIFSHLPIAGWSGTLAGRFTAPTSISVTGVLRAKTGTLDGVSALAGTVVDASGRSLRSP